MRVRLRAWAVLAVTVIVLDQLVQFTALADGYVFGHRCAPFDPPLFTRWQEQAARDMRRIAQGDERLRATSQFDAELGWCPRPGQVSGPYEHDWAGCRLQGKPLAREKVPGVKRIALLGCSFTQGAEVEAGESWSALLAAHHPELEFANLGVAGYGLDQALLRLRRDALPLAPDEVWLGFFPGAALRVTTQFSPLYLHWSSVLGFKPLFRLDEHEGLELVPSPVADAAAFVKLLADQRALLAAIGASDHWLRRSPAAYAPRGSALWQRSALARLFVSWQESVERAPEDEFARPASEVVRLLRVLVLQFERESHAAGARFRLLVLPGPKDLATARAAGRPYWDAWLADLTRSGIETLDLYSALDTRNALDDPGFWTSHGHYGPAGSAFVSEELERLMR